MKRGKFETNVIQVANHPDVAKAFRSMAATRNEPTKKNLFQRRQSKLRQTIGRVSARPLKNCGEVKFEAVLDYLESPMMDEEPKLQQFSKDNFGVITLMQRQSRSKRRMERVGNFGAALNVEDEILYRFDPTRDGRKRSNSVLIIDAESDEWSERPLGQFAVLVDEDLDNFTAVTVDGPAQALALADYYDRNGPPNPIKRIRLRRDIRRAKKAIRSRELEIQKLEKELQKLG